MKVTTFSSREFNQAASEAKRAANDGPVFITDRGKPAHVLMSMAHYQHPREVNKRLPTCWRCRGLKTSSLRYPAGMSMPARRI